MFDPNHKYNFYGHELIVEGDHCCLTKVLPWLYVDLSFNIRSGMYTCFVQMHGHSYSGKGATPDTAMADAREKMLDHAKLFNFLK